MQDQQKECCHSEEKKIAFHEKTLWSRFACVALGFWILVLPWTLEYFFKSFSIFLSDSITGIVIIVFGFLAISYKMRWASWVVTFAGIWLMFAPLLFWAPDSVMFINDQISGALAIVFALLIPGIASDGLAESSEIPEGWTYNPSAWTKRIPIIFLAFVAWFLSRYMAVYQLQYIPIAWDPVFGPHGTKLVITSWISKDLPVSDAGLGSLAYTLEFLCGLKGGSRRWHTIPWMVFIFGVLVIPVGIISVMLITFQPILVGHWCFWCLLTAGLMLVMIALAIGEVVATCQFLCQSVKRGESLWKVFWCGGTPVGGSLDTRTPRISTSGWKNFSPMAWGVTLPWNLVVSSLIGGWLMFSPWILGMTGAGADSDYITGAIVIVISIICMGEVIRIGRFLNILFGVWLIVSVWVLPVVSSEHRQWTNLAAGVLLILLCFYKGKIKEKYGSLEKWIK